MIKSVQAKFFQSWEELNFELPKGICIISGNNLDDGNSEGSGKSSILNAISWGLFGAIPKSANIDEVIQEGKKSCSVAIEFEDGTRIVRSRKPNDLYIYNPTKKEEIRGKDLKETQKVIEQMLGMSFETWHQTIYFAQNYPQKFITATDADKAKILSEIQNLEIFDRARREVQTRLKDVELKEFVLTSDISKLDVTLKGLKLKKSEFEELKLTAEKEKADNINTIKGHLNLADSKIKETYELIKKLAPQEELLYTECEVKEVHTKLTEEKMSLRTELAGLEERKKAKINLEKSLINQGAELKRHLETSKTLPENIKNKEEQLSGLYASQNLTATRIIEAEKALANPKKDKCPTCAQTWSGNLDHYALEVKKATKEGKQALTNVKNAEADLAIIKEALEINKKNIDNALAQVKSLKAQLKLFVLPETEELEKSLSSVVKDMDKLNENYAYIQGELKKHQNYLQDQRVSVDKYSYLKEGLAKEEQRDITSFDLKIDETEKDILGNFSFLSSQLNTLRQFKTLHSNLEVLKTGFKEVKGFVFQGVLEELNRKTNQYLSELFEQPVKLKFSNEGSEGEIAKIKAAVTIEGIERPLGLLSGGQFRRVELATSLALSDVVSDRGDKSMKLLILDEVLHNLSLESKEKFLELLKKRAGNIILIEHDDIYRQAFTQSIKIELKNGISRRIE